MFDGGSGGPIKRGLTTSSGSMAGQGKLLISNLDFGVNDSDIHVRCNIFDKIGDTKVKYALVLLLT